MVSIDCKNIQLCGARRGRSSSSTSSPRGGKSILVLKVPAEINNVALDVALKVVKCKRKWLLFSDMLPPATSTRTISVELDPKPPARSPS